MTLPIPSFPHLRSRALGLLACAFGSLLPVFDAYGVAGQGTVHVELCEEGLNNKDAWPATTLTATETLEIPAFALDTLPLKYTDDGVRGARPSPFLMRMSATVQLPAGRHQFLIRARSSAKLTVNGVLIAETPFPPSFGEDGSEVNPQRLVPLDLGPGYRWVRTGEFEKIGTYESNGGPAQVVLEAFVGGRIGKDGKQWRRPEPGETVVAISREGQTGWELLSPGATSLPYTDSVWESYRSTMIAEFDARNTAARAAQRAANDGYWLRRQALAAEWLSGTQDTVVPALPSGFTAHNAVDHFIADRLQTIISQNQHAEPGAVDFFRDVRPLLEKRCLDCHQGKKAKGGLRLDQWSNAKKGGESGAAIVPHKVDEGELLNRIRSHDPDEKMPPKGEPLEPAEIALFERWIREGASWPELQFVRAQPTPLADDLTFLRRVALDTVGVPPTPEEIAAFQADTRPDRRAQFIERMLSDKRWADHWMGTWMDVLAENPNILNPTLNNTGPFRWWLYEALRDDLPMDRMVTQLVLQRGDERAGAPAGFGVASQNDVPFAAKGTVVGGAFLGVDMKCSRCHDSPTGKTKQEDLFQIGAMLAEHALEVPKTSSVDPAKLNAGGRKALIEVTLKPGTKVEPAWPFAEFVKAEVADQLAPAGANARERLAALLTAPHNERFAQVIVNRIWQRYMGRGIVDPVDDWEKGTPTHPALLRWLGREFVRQGYQLKPIARLILNSQAYQRATDPALRMPDMLYAAPEPRRLSAEQVVDSLFSAAGKPFQVESVCLDLNGRREVGNSLDLGRPHRAWMLASLSNERDRPSLTLPRLQAVTDVMTALGWRGSRQDPISTRDTAPNALQPAILANGVMSGWISRLSDEHGITALALEAPDVETFVEALFMRLLSRPPTSVERENYTHHLRDGFDTRIVKSPQPIPPKPHQMPILVTWTNHLLPESNSAKQAEEESARRGDPPTPRLDPTWRARCEDVLWAVINSPEMLYRP